MKVWHNGILRDMTPEEMERMPKPLPPLDARVAQLEAERAADIAAYEEGVNNG